MIPWFSKTEGNTYDTLLHHPLLFGEIQRSAQEVARPGALPDDELAVVLRLIVGDNQEYPPSAFVPLFQRRDREEFVASRPTFDARGLVQQVLSRAPSTQKAVEVSSGESHGEGEEEADSEETPEEVRETSAPSKAEILCALPDDANADAYQGGKEQPLVPTKGRSSLVDRGAASTPTPPGAGSSSASAPYGAAGARTPAPQAPML